MKDLGLTQKERDLRDLERRDRNCFIALIAIVVATSYFLGWSS